MIDQPGNEIQLLVVELCPVIYSMLIWPGPPLLSYLVLKTKLPVVQFKAFSAVKKCGFEPKLFSIYYTFLFCFLCTFVSNVYGDGYLIWVIIKIKNNAQICSVVNEHVYFIISVAKKVEVAVLHTKSAELFYL